jgi:hypothetical protein
MSTRDPNRGEVTWIITSAEAQTLIDALKRAAEGDDELAARARSVARDFGLLPDEDV